MLGVLASLIRKGEAHMQEQELDPETLLEARLAPDMLTLLGQVQRASDHAKGGSGRLAGFEPPSFIDNERSLADAHARITRTVDYIATLPVEAFDVAAKRIITLPFDVPQMSGPQYLYGFALPSFYFHVTTAYAILRHRGVPLGKRDFLGEVVSR
jgi:hypothetical protein